MAALSKVALFLEMHSEARFRPLNPMGDDASSNSPPIRDRAGWRGVDRDGRKVFYVSPEVFKTEVCAGHEYKFVAGVLRKHGLLKTDEPDRLQYKHPKIGRTYAIRLPEEGFPPVSPGSEDPTGGRENPLNTSVSPVSPGFPGVNQGRTPKTEKTKVPEPAGNPAKPPTLDLGHGVPDERNNTRDDERPGVDL